MANPLFPVLIVAAVCTAAPARGAFGQIVVNEFLPSPQGDQQEFIELLNAGEAPVPLSRVSFRDGLSDWISVASHSPDVLEPSELIVLAPADQPHWNDVSFHRPDGWAGLNNSGDSIFVRIGDVTTDRVGYTGSERGRSVERLDPAVPGHVSLNWAPSTDPSGGSPGRVNSRYQPDTTPPMLLDAEWQPPRSLILWMSEPIAPASLGALRLTTDVSTPEMQGVSARDTRVTVPMSGADPPTRVRASGLADHAGQPMAETEVMVALAAGPGDVILSELLVEAGTGPDDLPEFVEITLRAGRPVSLRDAVLSIGTGPEPDIVPLSSPDSTRILHPGDVLLMYASPASGPTAAHVRNLIMSAIQAPDQAQVTPADPGRIALRNAGDLIRLLSPRSLVLDSVEYGPDIVDIRFREHRGRSIRRVRIGGPAHLSWASTLGDVRVTPGVSEVESAPGMAADRGDLVLSELMPRPLADPYDGRPDQPEYLEIANISNRPVDLNGIMLTGPPEDNGQSSTQRIVYQPLTLEPGRVVVVYELPASVGDGANEQFGYISDAFPHVWPGGIGFAQTEASLGRSDLFDGAGGLLLPLRGAVRLRDDGEFLRLLSPDGSALDSVTYSPAMHHPAVADPEGRALERTVVSRTPLRLGGWSTSSFPGGGSPGMLSPQSVPPSSLSGTGPSARLAPETITPDGDGHADRTVVLIERLVEGDVVTIDVFDIDGRRVRTLTPATLANGTFSAEWAGLDDARRPLSRGFYVVLVRIASADGARTNVVRLPVALAR